MIDGETPQFITVNFKLLFFASFLLFCSTTYTQSTTLIPYRIGDGWGYCNPKGEVLIPPIYDKVDEIAKYGSIRRVSKGDLTGCINANGEYILDLEPRFINILPHLITSTDKIRNENGTAKYYTYDFNGNPVFESPLSGVQYIDDEEVYIIRDCDRRAGVFKIDSRGIKTLIDTIDYTNIMFNNDSIYCYTMDEIHIYDPRNYQLIKKAPLVDDIMPDIAQSPGEETSGTNKQVRISYRYEDYTTNLAKKGLRLAKYTTDKNLTTAETSEITTYDTIPGNFTEIKYLKTNRQYDLPDTLIKTLLSVVVADESGLKGLINNLGQPILECDYQQIFHSELRHRCAIYYYLFQDQENKWGLVAENGNKPLPMHFDSIILSKNNYLQSQQKGYRCTGLAPGIIVMNGDKYGLFNLEGKQITSVEMDNIYYDQKKLSFFIQKDNLWGIYSDDGLYCPPVHVIKPISILNIDDYAVVKFYDKDLKRVGYGNTEGDIYYKD